MSESENQGALVRGREARDGVRVIPSSAGGHSRVTAPLVCRIGDHGHAIMYHLSFAESQVRVDGDPLDVAAGRLAACLEGGLAYDLAPWQHDLLARTVAEVGNMH